MKKLFACANAYIRGCDWKDLALIKFCLCAIGVIIGLCIPEKKRKLPLILAAIVFVATYIPLMVRFLPALCKTNRDSWVE